MNVKCKINFPFFVSISHVLGCSIQILHNIIKKECKFPKDATYNVFFSLEVYILDSVQYDIHAIYF